MTVGITQKFFTLVPKLPYRNGAGAFEGVVGHATDSYATAANEIIYMQRLWIEWDQAGRDPDNCPAFVHFFVDWTGKFYTADINYKSYGAGFVANQRYVHVELCQTRNPEDFKKSYDNYVETLAWILKQKALGVVWEKTLLTHQWVSLNLGGTTHTDPVDYLAGWGITIDKLVKDVTLAYDGLYNTEEDEDMLTLTDNQWVELADSLQRAYDGGKLGNWYYVGRAHSKTLTRSELDLANNLIVVYSAIN